MNLIGKVRAAYSAARNAHFERAARRYLEHNGLLALLGAVSERSRSTGVSIVDYASLHRMVRRW